MGKLLGNASINIAGMQVARKEEGGEALMAISVDSNVSSELVAQIEKETGADLVRAVALQS